MKNARDAGRKAALTSAQVGGLKKRWEAGESAAALAAECGISRQALYRHFKRSEYIPARIGFYVDGELSTLIEADFQKERVRVINYASELSGRAFGYENDPKWEEFLAFLEDCCLRADGMTESCSYLLREEGGEFSLSELEGDNVGWGLRYEPDSAGTVPVFRFSRKDLLLYRSDTDGYQLKAMSADRRYFVKAQAVMAGVRLRDWAVEIIASGLCRQFGIPCVEQKHCRFAYGHREHDAVYSRNFELDGHAFLSFESLLGRINRSSEEDSFIRLDAIAKLKWCAGQLAEIGELPYEKTERYMLDLAVLDCLLGNVDRHTRNFGLFYRSDTGKFEIPLVFDSGMGLFEHDHYRDRYGSYDEAMRNVYVSPYGEDPFELLEMLDGEFGLKSIYPGIEEPDYGELLKTPFALEYMERMKEAWRKLG
ncbi:MAG: HipA domain-containing protein [Lachnospiraceae bacterium]|nr:HipA domain-containing protein [Lachnospiraceae bacterium]